MAAQPDIDALLPLIRFRLALLIIAALNLGQDLLIPTAAESSLKLRIIAEGTETEQQHNFCGGRMSGGVRFIYSVSRRRHTR
jgi:hypothetical protein